MLRPRGMGLWVIFRNKVVIGVGIRLLEFYAVVMEPFLPEASKQILTTMSLTS